MTNTTSNQDPCCPHCNVMLTRVQMRRGICPYCGEQIHENSHVVFDAIQPPKFNLQEVLQKSWDSFTTHFSFFLAFILVIILLYAGPQYLSRKLPEVSGPYFAVLVLIFNILITLGQIRIFLDIAKGKSGDFTLLVSQYQYFLPYLLGTIVFAIICAAGFMLLIIPGIILMLQFQFFGYAIVDEDLGPMEALKRSSELTKDTKGQLFGFLLLAMVINLAGVLTFGVGIFITYPITQLAMAYIYLDLKANTDELPEMTDDSMVTPVEG